MAKVETLVASMGQAERWLQSKPQQTAKKQTPKDSYQIKKEDSKIMKHQKVQSGVHIVHQCKRPLGGEPGGNYIPPFYHEYNCVEFPNGKYQCNSTNAPKEWKLGQPKLGDSSEKAGHGRDYYFSSACKQADLRDNSCVADHLQTEWQKPRGMYDIGPRGEDCQEYSKRTLKLSLEACKDKP